MPLVRFTGGNYTSPPDAEMLADATIPLGFAIGSSHPTLPQGTFARAAN